MSMISKVLYFGGLGLAALGGLAAAWRLAKKSDALRAVEGLLLLLAVALLVLLGMLSFKDPLVLAVFAALSVASVLLVLRSFLGGRLYGPGLYATMAASALLTAYEAYLWVTLGRPPFQFLGETFLWLALVSALLLIITEKLQGITYLGQFVGVLVMAFLTFSAVWPDLQTKEMPPALQSAWFVPHVIVYLLGYGALTLAVITAVGQLVAQYTGSRLAGPMGDTSYKLVSLGFPFLTAGLVFGAFWGQTAWGAYWGWDPKENWALVTWLVYLVYLHMRYVKGWNRSKASWVLVAGVVVIFITYLAVNYLPTAKQSVHTYT